jgi:hypothetical protein
MRLTALERNFTDVREELAYEKERLERQRGAVLTLTRQITRLERRLDEWADWFAGEFPDEEVPDDEPGGTDRRAADGGV